MRQVCVDKKRHTNINFCGSNSIRENAFTLDFSSLLKNHFECSFVSSECLLQSSNVCFEVWSDMYNLR